MLQPPVLIFIGFPAVVLALILIWRLASHYRTIEMQDRGLRRICFFIVVFLCIANICGAMLFMRVLDPLPVFGTDHPVTAATIMGDCLVAVMIVLMYWLIYQGLVIRDQDVPSGVTALLVGGTFAAFIGMLILLSGLYFFIILPSGG